MLTVIKTLKGVSSRYLRKEFPEIRKSLWGKNLWSRNYSIATTGEVSLEKLRKYVENQGDDKSKLNSKN